MLVDGGAAVNLMPYTMLRKIGKLMKIWPKLTWCWWTSKAMSLWLKEPSAWSSPSVVRPFQPLSLSLRGEDLIIYCWVGIGYMPIVAYHLQCINASSNGSEIQWRWCKDRNLFNSSG
jgi:hypothetical protein